MRKDNFGNLEGIVEDSLSRKKIDLSVLSWILDNTETNLESAKEIFYELKQKGFDEDGIYSLGGFLERQNTLTSSILNDTNSSDLDEQRIITNADLIGKNLQKTAQAYKCLISIGLDDRKIASKEYLLGMNSDTIMKNYENLVSLGLSKKKIISKAELLSKDPKSILDNYNNLLEKGFTHEQIMYRADLLGNEKKTINKKFDKLISIGMKEGKIHSKIGLMAMNLKTVHKNYQHHIGLLKSDYLDRTDGKKLLMNQGQLLSIPPVTFCANAQYSRHLQVNYKNPVFLGTSVQLKRKKMAWILREVFDYRIVPKEDKKYTIKALYNFIQDNLTYLRDSINTLEKEKHKIRTKAISYKEQIPKLKPGL